MVCVIASFRGTFAKFERELIERSNRFRFGRFKNVSIILLLLLYYLASYSNISDTEITGCFERN